MTGTRRQSSVGENLPASRVLRIWQGRDLEAIVDSSGHEGLIILSKAVVAYNEMLGNTRPAEARGGYPAAPVRIHRQRRGPVVRIRVEDVADLDQLVGPAARYARHLGVALELVEPPLQTADHAARARAMALIDQALALARRAAPGLEIRTGVPAQVS